MTQVKGSGQVDIEYVLPVLKRKFGAGVAALYAGGIDQNIQAAQQSDAFYRDACGYTLVNDCATAEEFGAKARTLLERILQEHKSR